MNVHIILDSSSFHIKVTNNPQSGNLRIFLPLRFYVKQNFFQDEFRMNCTILQTILNQYDPPGQIMVFLGVVMILINVVSSMVWMAMYYDNIFYTIIGSSVVFMNVMLMIGIVYHRREFLIIFLW